MNKMNYGFCEVTDLKMDISFSMGEALGEFSEGMFRREFFVIYEGPPMEKDRKSFFEQLQRWIDKKEKERFDHCDHDIRGIIQGGKCIGWTPCLKCGFISMEVGPTNGIIEVQGST